MSAKRFTRFQGEETFGIPTLRIFNRVCGVLDSLTEAVTTIAEVAATEPKARHKKQSQPAVLALGARTVNQRAEATGATLTSKSRVQGKGKSTIRALRSALWRLTTFICRQIARFTSLTVRCLCYSVQRQIAKRRYYSREPSERKFGRRSLEHCAHILARKRAGLLSPNTRAARRLVRDASREAERAVLQMEMTEREAAEWLASIATEAEVSLATLDQPRRRRPQVSRDAETASSLREEKQAVPLNRIQTSDHLSIESLDEELPVIETRRGASEEEEDPSGFSFREEDELKDEVANFLEDEMRQKERPDGSAFSHDGD